MAGENWTSEEKRKLKAMTISPIKSSPKRLKEIVEYFQTPGASLWAVTEGPGPLHMSKSLGTKVRDYVDSGDLDWVMDETPGHPLKWFDSEWRQWLLSRPEEFSRAVEVFKEELGLQIQLTEVHLGLRAGCMSPKVAYGPSQRPYIESIFRRDPDLAEGRRKFDLSLVKGHIAEARTMSAFLGEALDDRVAV